MKHHSHSLIKGECHIIYDTQDCPYCKQVKDEEDTRLKIISAYKELIDGDNADAADVLKKYFPLLSV